MMFDDLPPWYTDWEIVVAIVAALAIWAAMIAHVMGVL